MLKLNDSICPSSQDCPQNWKKNGLPKGQF